MIRSALLGRRLLRERILGETEPETDEELRHVSLRVELVIRQVLGHDVPVLRVVFPVQTPLLVRDDYDVEADVLPIRRRVAKKDDGIARIKPETGDRTIADGT